MAVLYYPAARLVGERLLAASPGLADTLALILKVSPIYAARREKFYRELRRLRLKVA